MALAPLRVGPMVPDPDPGMHSAKSSLDLSLLTSSDQQPLQMRYHRLSVLSILASALLGHGSPATPPHSPWGEMLAKHKWIQIPDNWVTLGHPPEGATINLHIALKSDREDALIDALKEVSQPRHPKYGAHLTKEQVAQLVAPHPDTLEIVSSWLKHNGVPLSSISRTHGGCWLTVAGVPVSQADKLLGASYRLYYHPGTNETILRTAGYALPEALHAHVKTVAPTTAFTSTRLLQSEEMPGAVNATSGEPVDTPWRRAPNELNIVPSILRSLYKTEGYDPIAIEKNELAIVGYRNEAPSLVDLYQFMSDFRTDADLENLNSIPTIETINDSEENKAQAGKQADLDVQYSMALAFPTPVIYYRGTGNGPQAYRNGQPAPGDPYLQWLNHVLEQPTIPKTISLGYGTLEPSVPVEYAVPLCHLFAQLGVRGSTVFIASGDAGVGVGDCKNAYGYVEFYTVFPASCPFVTSVGGTKLEALNSDVEVANSLSGGGFSAIFTREDWQDPVVDAFRSKPGSRIYDGLYNPIGRGVPDIALQSSRYVMVYITRGRTSLGNTVNTYHVASGTSCSTNTAAAVFSLLNDYLLSKGRPSLGFVNPWLYEIGWLGFTDIISGTNPGCNTGGFSADEGWDPITGLGSPNFAELKSMLEIDDDPGDEEMPPAQP